METRDELQALANLVAKERGMASSNYRDVVAALRREAIADKALLPTYRERLAALEEIVRRERLVSLPERPAVIRLGTAGGIRRVARAAPEPAAADRQHRRAGRVRAAAREPECGARARRWTTSRTTR